MNSEYKKIFSFVVIALAAAAIYFGSILPFAKSQAYINAAGKLSSIRSIQEFQNTFDGVFNFYSPVGDEEVSKFLGSTLVGSISQPGLPEPATRALIEYIEPHMFKNNVRHLMMLGQMYFVLWQKSHQDGDYQKAENYYRQALAIGPKLPPVLYGLLNLYQIKGDIIHIQEIGDRILQFWPDDNKTRALLGR